MTDYIKLQYMTATGASEYQLEYNPAKMHIWFEHLQARHELAAGNSRFYHKGYKFMAQLVWTSPFFFRDDQYDRLRQIFNFHDGITIAPCPDSCPGACYSVDWTNDFGFNLVEGVTPFGYEGVIVLEGSDVLSQINSNIIMGKG